MKVEITDGKLRHCGQLSRSMRVDHHAALLRMGVPIHRELRDIFCRSYYRRAAFVGGHLAGLWGVEGTALSSYGKVWLVMSQYATTFPVTALRLARQEIEKISRIKSALVTTVIAEDEPAQRLVAFLGFESPDGFGGGRASSRKARNDLVRHLASTPELMVAAGTAQQVRVVWNREPAHG